MIQLLRDRLTSITELCRNYRVHRLEVFGSATGARFEEEGSDVDFLVDFLPLAQGEYADHYFGFRENLEAIVGRRVDLLMVKAIKNPYFIQAVESQREVLYAA